MVPRLRETQTHRATPLRTIVVVGSDLPERVFDAAVADGIHDLVFVESVASAYSRIKRIRPDLIVIRLSTEDLIGCQLLSMLALDDDTAGIPVVSYVAPDMDAFEGEPEMGQARGRPVAPALLN